MTLQYSYSYGQRRSTFLPVLLALIVGATVMGVFIHSARAGLAGRLASKVVGKPLNVLTPADVLEHIQSAGKISAATTLTTVVVPAPLPPPAPQVDADGHVLPTSAPAPQPTLLVDGTATAAVDLALISPASVAISDTFRGRSIRVTLPAAQITAVTVVDTSARVLTPGQQPQPLTTPLDIQLHNTAQQQLIAAANASPLTANVTTAATSSLTALLKGLGFSTVEILPAH